MDFSLNSDQATLATALDGLAARFETKPTDAHGFALVREELDQELAAAEFFDIAAIPELGAVAAAMAVERLARLPCASEFALSMLLRPHLAGGGLPRPFALVEHGRPGRFVASARTILLIDGETISVAHPAPGQAEPVESIYAYPMGRLHAGVAVTPLSGADANLARKWIRVALAAEIAGLVNAAIASTVEHLSVRKQFGRPLGAFQALRHRMAECAVLAGGVRWLALKAASTADDGDAALAALYAQDCAARVVYDLHQMLGAMGVTLEHPLHLWTYRLKALLSELGGRSGQASAVARHCFEAA
jgi:Acyl-CoA dehydrogenase, C-terminal domain